MRWPIALFLVITAFALWLLIEIGSAWYARHDLEQACARLAPGSNLSTFVRDFAFSAEVDDLLRYAEQKCATEGSGVEGALTKEVPYVGYCYCDLHVESCSKQITHRKMYCAPIWD
jgi:hypothetical protein